MGISVLNGMSSSKPSPQFSWSYEEEEAERLMDATKELCLPGILGLMHIRIYRNCGSMYRTCATQVQQRAQGLRGANSHNLPSLTKKLHLLHIHLKEKIVFSNGVSLNILDTLQDRPQAKQQMANTKFSMVFWFVCFKLFQRAVFGLIHCYGVCVVVVDFVLFYYRFQISVYICVCLLCFLFFSFGFILTCLLL